MTGDIHVELGLQRATSWEKTAKYLGFLFNYTVHLVDTREPTMASFVSRRMQYLEISCE